MTTVTKSLLRRQSLIEKEIAFLKKNLLEFDEMNIKPSALRRWERISRELDRGQGRFFSSVREMREWLKNL